MELALRVLQAITEKWQPDPQDIEKLRRLVPDSDRLSVDEIACDVVQQELKRRSQVRAAAARQ